MVFDEIQKRVNFIFLGLGHMGERALLNFLQVKEYFRQRKIIVELLAIADPKIERQQKARELCSAMLCNPIFFSNWDEIKDKLISKIDKIDKNVFTIVYDDSISFI